MDSFRVYDTELRYENKTDRDHRPWGRNANFLHYGYLWQILNVLKDEGFEMESDKTVSRIIRKDYIVGRRKDLQFRAHKFPNGFEIIFFQDIIHENPNGGFYDFHKRSKMPYLIGLQYEKYMKKCVEKLKTLVEVKDNSRIKTKMAEDYIKASYVESCHYPQTDMNFDLHALDGLVHEGMYGLDRDKKEIHNGDIKYFRNKWDGYVYRGRVYYDLNMNWFVILNKTEVDVVSCWELFDPGPEDNLHRKKDPEHSTAAKEYRNHMNKLAQESTKDLIIELKRRGIFVKK